MTDNFYTYFHTRNDTGAVFYVGKGSGKRSQTKANRNTHWHRIVAKHGHSVSIVEHFDDEQDSHDHERFLIASFKAMGARLVNMTDGGEGLSGHIHSAETRAKLSAANSNPSAETRAKMSLAARNPSAETRAKMSLAASNPSAEKRAKISAANSNPSAETRAKMSLSHRGKTNSAETRAKLSAINLGNTNSLGHSHPHTDASKAKLSLSLRGRVMSAEHRSRISAAATGRRHSPETLAKISTASTGRRHSAESLAKMSDARKLFYAEKKGTLPVLPVVCPVLPVMPLSATPLPAVLYSTSASENILKWRETLIQSVQSEKQ